MQQKDLSIPRLSSFLYELNRDLDLLMVRRIKSSANIRGSSSQLNARRKTEGGNSSEDYLPTDSVTMEMSEWSCQCLLNQLGQIASLRLYPHRKRKPPLLRSAGLKFLVIY